MKVTSFKMYLLKLFAGLNLPLNRVTLAVFCFQNGTELLMVHGGTFRSALRLKAKTMLLCSALVNLQVLAGARGLVWKSDLKAVKKM